MALLQLTYESRALAGQAHVSVLLPEQDGQFRRDGTTWPYRVLYLLHGLGDDELGWVRSTTVSSLARGTDVAVVMPGVGHSFYTNMARGQRFFDFVSEELPAYLSQVLPLSTAREDTLVCGNSMGGYGAFKLALTCPERFSRAAALSGALDIQRFVETFQQDGFDPRAAFGDELCVADTPNDLLWLLRSGVEAGRRLPELYSVCGTDDFLLEESRTFASAARDAGVDLTYQETPGEHLWTTWQRQFPEVFAWLTAR